MSMGEHNEAKKRALGKRERIASQSIGTNVQSRARQVAFSCCHRNGVRFTCLRAGWTLFGRLRASYGTIAVLPASGVALATGASMERLPVNQNLIRKSTAFFHPCRVAACRCAASVCSSSFSPDR
jgi:hypothetical protein